MFVSRDEDGNLNKVPVPLHYAYLFVAAAAIGMFTITGLAGSYSRMLIKTARFNQLRQDHNSLQKDYAHLEKAAHEKDIQAASLGSLASEVSALYGLTANKLATVPVGNLTDKHHGKSAGIAETVASAPLAGTTDLSEDGLLQVCGCFLCIAELCDERHGDAPALESRRSWVPFCNRSVRSGFRQFGYSVFYSDTLAHHGTDHQQLRTTRRPDSG